MVRASETKSEPTESPSDITENPADKGKPLMKMSGDGEGTGRMIQELLTIEYKESIQRMREDGYDRAVDEIKRATAAHIGHAETIKAAKKRSGTGESKEDRCEGGDRTKVGQVQTGQGDGPVNKRMDASAGMYYETGPAIGWAFDKQVDTTETLDS